MGLASDILLTGVESDAHEFANFALVIPMLVTQARGPSQGQSAQVQASALPAVPAGACLARTAVSA